MNIKIKEIPKPLSKSWNYIDHSKLFTINKVEYIVDVGSHDDLTHVVIRRVDHEPIFNYFDIQIIKDHVIGEEKEAIQVFPKKKNMMNGGNAYHIFSWNGMEVPNLVTLLKPTNIINEYGDSRKLKR